MQVSREGCPCHVWNVEGADVRISPLRRASAVWGLSGDDIGVLSIHETSAGANVSQVFSFYAVC